MRSIPHVILITLFLVFLLPVPAHGAESTPSATPAAAESSVLEDLKTRLATKVAQLRTVVRRAMSGTVKTVSLTSATVETKTKDIKIELTDDVTVAQIIGGKRTELDVSDIDTDDTVTVFGSYDETLDLLKASHIFIEKPADTVRLTGTVADTDSDEFTITVSTRENRTVTVDFEKTTKTVSWSKDKGIVKSGFSKIAVGNTVHITAEPDTKNPLRFTAVRILDLGNLTGAVVTETPAPEASSAATTSPAPTRTRAPSPSVTP